MTTDTTTETVERLVLDTEGILPVYVDSNAVVRQAADTLRALLAERDRPDDHLSEDNRRAAGLRVGRRAPLLL